MPTFQEHLKRRSSPFATKKPQQTLQEGTELSASDLIDELTAPQVHSIAATVVTDNAEGLTILLEVKKWTDATDRTADSFAQHLYTAQTNALPNR